MGIKSIQPGFPRLLKQVGAKHLRLSSKKSYIKSSLTSEFRSLNMLNAKALSKMGWNFQFFF